LVVCPSLISTTDRRFSTALVLDLCLSLELELFVPKEKVFKEGSKCDKLYITERGIVLCHGKFYGQPTQAERSVFMRKKDVGDESQEQLSKRKLCWIGLSGMTSADGLHRHTALSLTNTVLLALCCEELVL